MTEQRIVYLDHNATTPLHPEVQNAMSEAMEIFGNPSSLHSYGRSARSMVEEARNRIAAFIGASHDEIIFVGSGSEANNTVLQTLTCMPYNVCNLGIADKGAAVVTTAIEHPCIMEAAKCLRERGSQVAFLGVGSDGKVDMDQLKSEIGPNTGLVSVMMANNETGTIQDVKTLAKIAHENGAFFHTDGVQAVGKIPVDVKELGIKYMVQRV